VVGWVGRLLCKWSFKGSFVAWGKFSCPNTFVLVASLSFWQVLVKAAGFYNEKIACTVRSCAERRLTERVSILVPTAHDPSGLRQGSRARGWSNTGSRRFTDFSSNLANLIGWEYETNTLRMLRRSGPARALDPCRRPEGSWALGTRMRVF